MLNGVLSWSEELAVVPSLYTYFNTYFSSAAPSSSFSAAIITGMAASFTDITASDTSPASSSRTTSDFSVSVSGSSSDTFSTSSSAAGSSSGSVSSSTDFSSTSSVPSETSAPTASASSASPMMAGFTVRIPAMQKIVISFIILFFIYLPSLRLLLCINTNIFSLI